MQSVGIKIRIKMGRDGDLDGLTKMGTHIKTAGAVVRNLLDTNSLIDCLHLRGPLSKVRSICERFPPYSWILLSPASPFPSQFKGVQSAALDVLTTRERCIDLAWTISKKAAVTLEIELPVAFIFPPAGLTTGRSCCFWSLCF